MVTFMPLIILLIIFLTLLYVYFSHSYKYWSSRGVPCHKPTFFFGNLLDIIVENNYPGKYLGDLYLKFKGPYFGFYVLDRPFLVLRDPKLIHRIFMKDNHIFPNRFFYQNESIDSIMANSLIGIKQPHWKTLRTKLSYVFTSGQMKRMLPLMKECVTDFENYVKANVDHNVNIGDICGKYMTDILTSCIFGVECKSFKNENNGFRQYAKKLFSNNFRRATQALSFAFVPLAIQIFRFKFIGPEASSFLGNAFSDALNKRIETKAKRNDLIDLLIELKEETPEDDFKFYGDRLIAQAIVFFTAGYEANSAIAFALHELAFNPDLQNRARKEIREVIEKYGEVSYEAIQDMTYLHMVLFETLRKYPLNPFIQRECVEDYKVKETGLIIEKGSAVIIPHHGIQWDPQYYPDPEKFDPERFSEENKAKQLPGTYMPFGGGPRSCIGDRFAQQSCKLALIHILKDYAVEPNSDTTKDLTFGRSPLLHCKNVMNLTIRKA